MKLLLSALAIFSLFFTACSPDSGSGSAATPVIPEADPDGEALVIALDQNDKLVDVVRISPESRIQRVEFAAPENDTIYMIATGRNVAKGFKLDRSLVSSSRKEHMLGYVTAEIRDGVVTSLSGNTMSRPGNYEERFAAVISEARAVETRTNLDSTTIVMEDRHKSQWIEDEDGNLRRPELSEAEADFLDQVTSVMLSGDYENLIAIGNNGDLQQTQYIINGFKNFAPFEYSHYEFARIDREHPDNQDIFTSHDGKEYDFTVEPVYTLDLVIQQDGMPYPMKYGLNVGIQDGVLTLAH